uniref:Serine/threonine protein kinase n=1 Tax=Streptomyces sp. NBC_00049 TaxID=2903617 RepID=A0AAU2JRF8_9ACTN
MSSQEMPVTITPQQAAHGVILPVQLPTGPARLRIPPSREGDLVRARVGDQELLLRIHVAGSGAAYFATAGAGAGAGAVPGAGTGPPQPAPGARTGRGCLVAVLAAAVVVAAVLLVNGGDGSDDKASDSPTPTWSSSAWSSPPATPWSAEPTTAPNPAPTPYSPAASAEPSPEPSAEPSPFDRGTCLNGQLPDSTTPQSVSGVDEVPCSASDAHYRVIESIPGTADMDRCDANPKTQYAFSYQYMRGGTVLNQYVYCLVGLGSYAR